MTSKEFEGDAATGLGETSVDAPLSAFNSANPGTSYALRSQHVLTRVSSWLPVLVILLAATALYGPYLWNPIVFDDAYFFDGQTPQLFGASTFKFDLRWLPYASLGWTANLLGLDLIWFRLGNLALHAANAIVLFFFLKRLFTAVLPAAEAGNRQGLPIAQIAFFAAIIFVSHPAAVYAAAYLVQRSILMATLFSLVTCGSYLQALLTNKRRWFVVSVVFYFLAVFSKEHSVMVPGVLLAMTFLLRPPSWKLFKEIVLPFAAFGLIGLAVILKIKGVLGNSYEPYALEMLKKMAESQASLDVDCAYPLSLITQSFLFFKYWIFWVLPSTAGMSVDIREPLTKELFAWPHAIGPTAFVLYGLFATRLLMQRGNKGLVGFALLFPWLLFMTELSTVRIQESFVLYRSYPWMVGLFAALPWALSRLSRKTSTFLLVAICVVIIPASRDRLTTFSHDFLLWDDAARLVRNNAQVAGTDRIFYNRGNAYSRANHKQEAIEDYAAVISANPRYVHAYHNRGVIYYEMGRQEEAINDFNKALALDPKYAKTYLARGLSYKASSRIALALQDFKQACDLGLNQACGQRDAIALKEAA